MKEILIFILLVLPIANISAQKYSGEEVLNKAIQFHDSNNHWSKANLSFFVQQNTPEKPQTKTKILINNLNQRFEFALDKKGHRIEYIVEKDSCYYKCDSITSVPDSLVKHLDLDINRGIRIRNYYTYLWGLPMKLKDPGTIIDPYVEPIQLQGKDVYKMKVTYEAAVGRDFWFFYFDQTSFEMVAYEFYHDLHKKDGEYVFLKDLIEVDGILIPKERSWYSHRKDAFLGKDVLIID